MKRATYVLFIIAMGVMMITAPALFTAGYPSIYAKKGSDSDGGSSDGGGSDSGGSSENDGPTTGQGMDEKTGEKLGKDQPKTENPEPAIGTNPVIQKPIIPMGEPKTNIPDQSCAFNPDSPKCKPDPITGKCPPGFSHNVHDNCFPSGKCPPGFGRHDGDESGKCFPNHPFKPCPPGFKLNNKHICEKNIVINIHKHTSSSGSSSHSLSGDCFDAIKIAWLDKVHRGQNHEVDNFIDKCLGVH